MKNVMRKKTECLDETPFEDIEEDISDTKNDNSENNVEEKELGCLDENSPEETEDDVCDKKMTIVRIMTRKINLDA